MAHTPGPWRVHSEHADRIIVNGCCVYRVGNLAVPDSYEPGVMGAPDHDDVRLMAAAPELLEACQDLLDLVGFELQEDPNAEELDGMRRAYDTAAAAIAKAEGRSE